MLNVIMAEPVPSLNKGEAAILKGIKEALRIVFKGVKLSVYSPAPWFEEDKKRYQDEIKVVTGIDLWDVEKLLSGNFKYSKMHSLKNRTKLLGFALLFRLSKRTAELVTKDEFLKSLAESDLILAGHDGNLDYHLFWIVLAAKLMRKPIALFGGGNEIRGRHKKWRTRKMLQFAVHNSLVCTVRDENSRNYLIENDVRPEEVFISPDPAVLLKPCSKERVREILKAEGVPEGKPLLGLIPVRGGIVFENSFSHETDPDKRYRLRVKMWIELILHLLQTTRAHLILIPHCIGSYPGFDDRIIMRDIYEQLPESKDRITLIQKEYSEADLKGLIRECEFVVAERAHALIAAVSVATPCVGLTVKEDLRMHYIIGRMFGRKVFDLNKPDLEELKRIMSEEWFKRKETRVEMKQKACQACWELVKVALILKRRLKRFYERQER